MELQDFIATTLADLARGLQQANAKIMGERGETVGKDRVYFLMGRTSGGQQRAHVAFDLAVTVSSQASGNAKAGAWIKIVEAGVEGEVSRSHETASRIKFTVEIEKDLV